MPESTGGGVCCWSQGGKGCKRVQYDWVSPFPLLLTLKSWNEIPDVNWWTQDARTEEGLWWSSSCPGAEQLPVISRRGGAWIHISFSSSWSLKVSLHQTLMIRPRISSNSDWRRKSPEASCDHMRSHSQSSPTLFNPFSSVWNQAWFQGSSPGLVGFPDSVLEAGPQGPLPCPCLHVVPVPVCPVLCPSGSRPHTCSWSEAPFERSFSDVAVYVAVWLMLGAAGWWNHHCCLLSIHHSVLFISLFWRHSPSSPGELVHHHPAYNPWMLCCLRNTEVSEGIILRVFMGCTAALPSMSDLAPSWVRIYGQLNEHCNFARCSVSTAVSFYYHNDTATQALLNF